MRRHARVGSLCTPRAEPVGADRVEHRRTHVASARRDSGLGGVSTPPYSELDGLANSARASPSPLGVHNRPLTPRAIGDQAPPLEINPLRQLPVRHVRRPANLSSLITQSYPPDWSSPIQSHGCPPFVWPCLGLVSRGTEYRPRALPRQ